MTDSQPAEASLDREVRTDVPGHEPGFGTSLRRRATRRRRRARASTDDPPIVRLVGDRTASVGVLTARAAAPPSDGPLTEVVCSICCVEFDAFTCLPEATFFAMIHNGLHHGARPVAVASQSPRPAQAGSRTARTFAPDHRYGPVGDPGTIRHPRTSEP